MELFINDTPIGITPNGSDTLQSLVEAVNKELEEGLIIVTMMVDGKYQSIEDPAVMSLPVSKISRVDLLVSSRLDLCISFLAEGKQFVSVGVKELQSGSLAHKNEFVETFSWILESLDALKNSVAFPPADIHMLRAVIQEAVKRLDGDLSVDEAVELGNQLAGIVDLFDIIAHKLTNENDFSKDNVMEQLKTILPKLPEVASNFQVGQDLTAIQDMCKIVDMIEMFTRLSASMPEDSDLEQHSIALRDLSLQMLNAFENKDFVLIADLIEYDLSECIEDIIEGQKQ